MRWLVFVLHFLLAASSCVTAPAFGQSRPVVPGSGTLIDYVSDDFEDANWEFIHRHPKSSREQDEQLRGPRGASKNGRWSEGPERGQPDQIEVVPTPKGGLDGSRQALLLRTLNSGIPGVRTMDVQQDDLICDSLSLIGLIPAAESPNFTVRVYLPPFEEWERRNGPHFGIRMSASTTVTERKGAILTIPVTKEEPYWPGMWVHFRRASKRQNDQDSAFIAYRGNRMGHDVRIRDIEETGWWTFGMSMTPDGAIHYYASPGIDELTAADHLTSQFPYTYRAENFRTFFFDSCNLNDGRTWSTPVVIDDPKLYVVNSQRIESLVARRNEAQARRQAMAERKPARRSATRRR